MTHVLKDKRFRGARLRTLVSAYLQEDGTKISKQNRLKSSRWRLRGQRLTSWGAPRTSSPGVPPSRGLPHLDPTRGLRAWCPPSRGLPHLDPPPRQRSYAPPTARGLIFRPPPRPGSVLSPCQQQGKGVRSGLCRPGYAKTGDVAGRRWNPPPAVHSASTPSLSTSPTIGAFARSPRRGGFSVKEVAGRSRLLL
jgi:hypothetical protein